MVVGALATLTYLRSLGFETFTPIIDEYYDALIDNGEKMQSLCAAIDRLGALDDNRRAADFVEKVAVSIQSNFFSTVGALFKGRRGGPHHPSRLNAATSKLICGGN